MILSPAVPTDTFGLAGNVVDGQYHVIEVVGEGGFSVVYRGQHLSLREPIAIKCMKLGKTNDPTVIASFTQRFFDESRISYRLSQGNLAIVRSITSGTTLSPKTGQTVPYMVLEWLEGVSLGADFKARRERKMKGRSLEEVIAMFEPVAGALAYAHSQGIAHRDIKPGNIFIAQTSEGTKLKVLDFGMAKVLDAQSTGFEGAETLGGMMVISPNYSAPEQFEPSLGAVGAHTDVYSFALVLIEALADRRARMSENFAELMISVADPARAPTPRAIGLDVSDALEAVFRSALTTRASDRPKDVATFWAALKQAARAGANAASSPRREFQQTTPAPANLPAHVQAFLKSAEAQAPAGRGHTLPLPPPRTSANPSAPPPAPQPQPRTPAMQQTMALVPGARNQAEVARALALSQAVPAVQPAPQPAPPERAQAAPAQATPAPMMAQAHSPTAPTIPPNAFPPKQNWAPPPAARPAPEPERRSSAGLVVGVLALIVVVGIVGYLVTARYLARNASTPPASSIASATPSAPSPGAPSSSAGSSLTVSPSATATGSEAASPSSEVAPPVVESAAASASSRRAGSDPAVARATSANTALSMTDALLGDCREPKGPTGKGTATVTFRSDGSVATVVIDKPPYAGTSVGSCVGSRYRGARMTPFEGGDYTVEHAFDIER